MPFKDTIFTVRVRVIINATFSAFGALLLPLLSGVYGPAQEVQQGCPLIYIYIYILYVKET